MAVRDSPRDFFAFTELDFLSAIRYESSAEQGRCIVDRIENEKSKPVNAFSCSLSADRMENYQRFPTALRMLIGSMTVADDVILSLINMCNSTKISIIRDALSATPPSARPRVLLGCDDFISVIRNNARILQHRVVPVDSGVSTNFTAALIQAAQFSRGGSAREINYERSSRLKIKYEVPYFPVMYYCTLSKFVRILLVSLISRGL